MSIIKLNNVNKQFKVGDTIIFANKDISFEINEGEFAVILGPSGAGKTTLLNILGGMESPTNGDVLVSDVNIAKMNEKELTLYRRNDVGFVFQFYNLMPNLTAKENVEIAVEITKDHLDVEKTLDDVNLGHRVNNFPAQLSGGEQQRVAIARALAKNPKLLLCDEPTGALDYETGKKILKLLYDTSKKYNKTIVVVTHNQAIKDMADRVITVKNGQIQSNIINTNPMSIEDIEW
ncbi:ABC transporter ATP-binding protein [Haploplasma axanthum]|uniref:ABC transporter, ATP-binding protein n=1 Tax=Haploplasma axanthum TaxID=29552 RepID=A0A449BF30_HAPAX|nr:ABC transporter ATP-binding protein [Haploplasma axanthum]VEU81051.1 ABC transporter, ATP-binding protein [Haploplasma axanthum]